MKRFISVALLAALLAGCAHDSPCVPVYDDQGRLVHTNTCMKGTTQDNWETAGAIAGGAAAVAGLTLGIGCETAQFPLTKVGKDLFRDLKRVARTMDSIDGGDAYQQICDQLVACFDNPELTFSARSLRSMIDQGIGGTGRSLSAEYREMLIQEPLEILSEADFVAEREASVVRQKEVEAADTESFEAFLAKQA